MIARFHRRYPSAELPKCRSELYQQICTLQIKDRPNARKLESMLPNCETQDILQMLALDMMQEKEERLDKDLLLQRLTRYLRSQDESITAHTFLKEVEEISELLVKQEEEYEFAHLSFQEFLAAMEVIRLGKEELLYEHFETGWWKQTILLYVSKVKKPSRIIQAMRQAGATQLAYDCMQETTKQIDNNLRQDLEKLIFSKNKIQLLSDFDMKQFSSVLSESLSQQESEKLFALLVEGLQVTAERYQKLKQLLIEAQTDIHKWREADEETYRLMVTAVGKEEGQGFSAKDLKEFPCHELQEIDQLWVIHSRGLYGFSVQKHLYVQCGGTLDYEEPNDEVKDLFYETIAWREKGKWKLEWDEILDKKRMSAPGHLPWGWRSTAYENMKLTGNFGRIRGLHWFFASRVAQCDL